jgi:hypothetical protein
MAKTVADAIALCVKTTSGGPPATITVPEAALQTFVKGELVFLSVPGFATEIASDTPAVIYGLAEEDAHNDAVAGTHSVAVAIAVTSNLFAANAKEAALANHVLVQQDIGRFIGIQRDTTNNKVFLNTAVQGANARAFTYEVAQDTEVGDTNGRLVFSIHPNFAQMLGTS